MNRVGWGSLLTLGTAAACLAGSMSSCSGGDDSAATADSSTSDVARKADTSAPLLDADVDAACAPSLPGSWKPPAFAPPPFIDGGGVCTTSQIQMDYDDCIASASTRTACTAFLADASNAACDRCMLTTSTATTYGAVIEYPNDTTTTNLGGCMALLQNDFSPGGCGALIEAAIACEYAACGTQCVLDETTPATSDATYAQFKGCESASFNSVCKSYANLANHCLSTPEYSACVAGAYEPTVLLEGRILCGLPSMDAGADAADQDAADAADD